MLKKTVIGWSLAAGIVGILGFALTNRWLIINVPFFHRTAVPLGTSAAERTSVVFHLPRREGVRKEARDVLCSADPAVTAAQVVKAWLNILDEEGLLEKKTTVQSTAAAHKKSVLLLSLDRSPLNEQFSTREKLFIIESLLATLRELALPFSSVLFLVHHQPMQDVHLDFSQPWPIAGFLGNQIKKAPEPQHVQRLPETITIMLDPAGDAQQTGRVIDDSFERSVTLLCAQELKVMLEEHIPFCRVVLTRVAGETIDPLQNATFANRLQVDLFISINAFHEASGPATCALFYFLYNPVTDLWAKKETPISFIPSHAAHCATLPLTIALAQKLQEALAVHQRRGEFKLAQLLGVPFKPLMGVQAPALAIECGVIKKETLTLFIPPLVEGIKSMVELLRALAPELQRSPESDTNLSVPS